MMKAIPSTAPMAAAAPDESPRCAEGLLELAEGDVGADAEVAGLRIGDEEPMAGEEAIVLVAETLEVVEVLLEVLNVSVPAQSSPCHQPRTYRSTTDREQSIIDSTDGCEGPPDLHICSHLYHVVAIRVKNISRAVCQVRK